MVHVPYFSISPWTLVPSNFAMDEWRRRWMAKGRNRALPCGESRLRSNASFCAGAGFLLSLRLGRLRRDERVAAPKKTVSRLGLN